MPLEGILIYTSVLSVAIHILLAPIVYFKITRKLDKIDPNLKYSMIAAMPPILQQNIRGMMYSTYIIINAHSYRDIMRRDKKVTLFHFRKYCSKFDVLLGYLHVFSLVLLGVLSIIFGIFYME